MDSLPPLCELHLTEDDANPSLEKGGLMGQGIGHVGDEGTCCVKIEWPKHTEHGCKYMFKAGDADYGVNSVLDGAAKVNRYEISH